MWMKKAFIISFSLICTFLFVQPVAFAIFFVSMLAVTNMTPFDSSTAESEIAGGYQTEYTGMRYAVILLGKYSMLLVMALFGSVLFLGGWHGPPSIEHILKAGESVSSITGLVVSLGFWILVITAFAFLAYKGLVRIRGKKRYSWMVLASISAIALIVLHLIGSSTGLFLLQLGSVWLMLNSACLSMPPM